MGDNLSDLLTLSERDCWTLAEGSGSTDPHRAVMQFNGRIQRIIFISREVRERAGATYERTVPTSLQSTRELPDGAQGDLVLTVTTPEAPSAELGSRQVLISPSLGLRADPLAANNVVWESSIQVEWAPYGEGPTFDNPREAVEYFQSHGFEFIYVDHRLHRELSFLQRCPRSGPMFLFASLLQTNDGTRTSENFVESIQGPA